MERYVKIFKKIDDIKDIWDSLYSGGTDMTPYQSFEWNKNVADCYKSNTYIFLNFTVRYFVCFKDKQPLVIAPLALPKNQYSEGSYTQILGQYTKSGALNFIYGNEASGEDFRFLIEYIKNVYPNEMRFYEIGEYTRFDGFLSEYDEAERISGRICVRCNAPSTKEDFLNGLEEETLLDIEDYLKKDKPYVRVEINRGYHFGTAELEEISSFYEKAENRNVRSKPKPVNNGLKALKKLQKKVFKNKDAVLNFAENKNSVFVSCYIKNRLAGFFFAVTDKNGSCIVPSLVADADYSDYSPEMIMLYEFMMNGVENENLKVLDLSRGDDAYKTRFLPNPEKYLNNDYKIEADRSFLKDIREGEVK